MKRTPRSNSSIPHYIQVHNVYNKPETQNSPVLDQVASILSRAPTDTLPRNSSIDHLIVGDFNIHHPSWGGHIIRLDIRAFRLLELIDKFNLSQHLPPGTATYISSIASKSTLDLVFTSTSLIDRIQMCNVVEELDHDSDHMPIGTVLDLTIQTAAPDTR